MKVLKKFVVCVEFSWNNSRNYTVNAIDKKDAIAKAGSAYTSARWITVLLEIDGSIPSV